jgi:hypothetical protein
VLTSVTKARKTIAKGSSEKDVLAQAFKRQKSLLTLATLSWYPLHRSFTTIISHTHRLPNRGSFLKG